MNTGHTTGDLILGRCTCNDTTRSHVIVKCCVENCQEWYAFPKSNDERILCSCGAINFVCKCYLMHNVPVECANDYTCMTCDARADPPLA